MTETFKIYLHFINFMRCSFVMIFLEIYLWEMEVGSVGTWRDLDNNALSSLHELYGTGYWEGGGGCSSPLSHSLAGSVVTINAKTTLHCSPGSSIGREISEGKWEVGSVGRHGSRNRKWDQWEDLIVEMGSGIIKDRDIWGK
jgi:hypothetical protein